MVVAACQIFVNKNMTYTKTLPTTAKPILYWINKITYCIEDEEVVALHDNPTGTRLGVLKVTKGKIYKLMRFGRESHKMDAMTIGDVSRVGGGQILYDQDKTNSDWPDNPRYNLKKDFITLEGWIKLRSDKIDNIIK